MTATETAEATALASLLQRHEALSRAWLTNFCGHGLWERLLSPAFREALLALTDEELQRLAVDLPVSPSWPAEMRELVLAARRCAPPAAALRGNGSLKPAKVLFEGVAHSRNMNPKKRHEVLRLAPLVARKARECGAHTVVDLGSGHGYLSHVLAFHFGLHVIGLEASVDNAAAAHQRAWMVREKLRDSKFRVAKGVVRPGGERVTKAAAASTAVGDASATTPKLIAPHVAAATSGGRGERALAAAEAAVEAAAAASAATVAAGYAALRRGGPTPLITHAGGSFSNLAVRLHPECALPWLLSTVSPAIRQITDADAAGGGVGAADGSSGAGVADGAIARGGASSPHRFLLVGLHCCGDLTPTLLRLAATAVTAASAGNDAASTPPDGSGDAPPAPATAPPAPRCVGVVSVGCCYQRVSEPLAGERPALAVTAVPTAAVAQGEATGAVEGSASQAADGVASASGNNAPVVPTTAASTAAAATQKEEEEEADGGGGGADEAEASLRNFPMSEHCQALAISLGEIALHLSLQAVWRWPAEHTSVEETRCRTRQMLYRCVLEVRLQQLREPTVRADGMKLPRDGNVGSLPPCGAPARLLACSPARLLACSPARPPDCALAHAASAHAPVPVNACRRTRPKRPEHALRRLDLSECR